MSENMELPQGWALSNLAEVALINPKLPFEDINDETEVSFLPMKLVEEVSNTIHLKEFRKYSEVKKGFTPMADGDVIFAKITPCMENGKIAVVHSLRNQIGFGSTEFHVFRCSVATVNQFLFFFLVQAQFRQDAQHKMTGAVGQKRVPKKYLEDHPYPLPPLAEQHRIVAKIEELFSSLDKGIESLKTAQAQLKTYRQAVLKWAFEGKLTNENVKDGELPEGWKWEKFEKIVEFSQNGIAKRKGNEGKLYKVLRLADIENSIIASNNFREILLTEKEFEKYRINENDLLCIRVNGSKDLVGNVIYVSEVDGNNNWAFCDHLIRFVIKKEHISKYFAYFFKTVGVRKYVHDNMVTSAGQNTVSQPTMLNVSVPICSSTEQCLIVAEIEKRLSVCDKLEESITQSLSQAEALRQSILKKAFEGKLVPQDPNDEPASVLLERIRAERAASVKESLTLVKKRKKV